MTQSEICSEVAKNILKMLPGRSRFSGMVITAESWQLRKRLLLKDDSGRWYDSGAFIVCKDWDIDPVA